MITFADIESTDGSSLFVVIATVILIVVLLTGYVLMQEFSRSGKAHRTHAKKASAGPKSKRKAKRK